MVTYFRDIQNLLVHKLVAQKPPKPGPIIGNMFAEN